MIETLEKIEPILLMGPGPSCVPEDVYAALASPTIGHLDPVFITIMDKVKQQLRSLFNTGNALTMPISGTGSAGMETCFVNLVEPGDRVLVLINGVFGMRMQDVATRLGAEVNVLEYTWGTPVDPEEVARKVAENDYKIVAVVHAETSTGVRNPVEKIGGAVRDSGALFLVDTVTSLGGIEVAVDAWHADAVYSGTQKCLSCPPGLAPISFSAAAVKAVEARKTKVPNWYLDLSMLLRYWEGETRTYHHTAPINMIYGLHQALALILEEGTASVFHRHAEQHRNLVKGLETLGLEMLVAEPYRLPMLNAVKLPADIDEAAVRGRLRKEHRIEIGAGLGPLAGKIWRIGLMGHTARVENVQRFLAALKEILSRL
ncbi:MAG: alanine--glyoxylate aminotransferase family protein [Deltaproteobacteria bacterium]|nr:alanine--glyoxylate aminotransferase family protein [Deltaproteobacteria bacterium]